MKNDLQITANVEKVQNQVLGYLWGPLCGFNFSRKDLREDESRQAACCVCRISAFYQNENGNYIALKTCYMAKYSYFSLK